MDITYNQELNYISLVTSGIVNMIALREISQKIKTSIANFHCQRILHDLRDAQIDLETYEIYNTPERVKEAGYSTSRRALIFSSDAQDFSFFETVSSNKGQLVRVFTDDKEAIDWLLS